MHKTKRLEQKSWVLDISTTNTRNTNTRTKITTPENFQ